MPRVEVSPSSKASCGVCKNPIMKGDLRTKLSSQNVHLSCWPYVNHIFTLNHFELVNKLNTEDFKKYEDQINSWNEVVKKEKEKRDLMSLIGRDKKRRRKSIDHPALRSVKNQKISFNILPKEMLTMIFTFLPHRGDVIAMSLVCKLWHSVSNLENLWESYAIERIPAYEIIKTTLQSSNPNGSEKVYSAKEIYNYATNPNSLEHYCAKCGKLLKSNNVHLHPERIILCQSCCYYKDRYQSIPESTLEKEGIKAKNLRKYGLFSVTLGFDVSVSIRGGYTKYEEFFSCYEVSKYLKAKNKLFELKKLEKKNKIPVYEEK